MSHTVVEWYSIAMEGYNMHNVLILWVKKQCEIPRASTEMQHNATDRVVNSPKCHTDDL